MNSRQYLYRHPRTGHYTGLWACGRAIGPYTGRWPAGLVGRVYDFCGRPQNVLEPFGGTSKLGISIDLNREVRPTLLADAHNLPIREGSFEMVLMDPPYEEVYHQGYMALTDKKVKLRFYRALEEATRCVRPGGWLVVLHFLIPNRPRDARVKRVATIGISPGPNKRIRCLSIFRKGTRPSRTQALLSDTRQKGLTHHSARHLRQRPDLKLEPKGSIC